MDLRKFVGYEKLSDEEMVYLIEKICSIKILVGCAYIDPLALELVMRKTKEKKYTDKESVYKNLGPYFSNRIEDAKVILIILFNKEAKHWSLVYYVKEMKRIYHYDSVRPISYIGDKQKEFGLNRELFCSVIKFLVKWEIIESGYKALEPKFIPKQVSGWECGYHVIINAYLLCLKNDNYRPISKSDIQKNKSYYDFTPGSKARIEILNLVIDFINEEKKKKEKDLSFSLVNEGKQEVTDSDKEEEKEEKELEIKMNNKKPKL